MPFLILDTEFGTFMYALPRNHQGRSKDPKPNFHTYKHNQQISKSQKRQTSLYLHFNPEAYYIFESRNYAWSSLAGAYCWESFRENAISIGQKLRLKQGEN